MWIIGDLALDRRARGRSPSELRDAERRGVLPKRGSHYPMKQAHAIRDKRQVPLSRAVRAWPLQRTSDPPVSHQSTQRATSSPSRAGRPLALDKLAHLFYSVAMVRRSPTRACSPRPSFRAGVFDPDSNFWQNGAQRHRRVLRHARLKRPSPIPRPSGRGTSRKPVIPSAGAPPCPPVRPMPERIVPLRFSRTCGDPESFLFVFLVERGEPMASPKSALARALGGAIEPHLNPARCNSPEGYG
jgi:hypothetical protein